MMKKKNIFIHVCMYIFSILDDDILHVPVCTTSAAIPCLIANARVILIKGTREMVR